MQRKSKVLWPLATSLVAFTSVLSADVSDSQVRNMENRISALEQRKGANGVINPNGRPQTTDGIDLFVTADLLLWQAHEDGLSYAIKQDLPNDALWFQDGKVLNPEYSWDWGFRVGVGYNLPHDGWDVLLNYTWLRSTANRHTRTNGTSQILTTTSASPSTFVSAGNANNAKEGLRINLNVLDLELGRQFYTSKWLTLRPHIGLRTAWVHQKDNVGLTNININDAVAVVGQGGTEHVNNRNNFWGLGVRGGLDTQWGLGHGWSIYGNAAFSLLYGFTHSHYNEYAVAADGTTTPEIDIVNSPRNDRAVTDLQLGLRWAKMFSNDSWGLMIQAGWEHHMWFSQNQMPHFVDDTAPGVFVANQGDLSYQGWTLNVRFDF